MDMNPITRGASNAHGPEGDKSGGDTTVRKPALATMLLALAFTPAFLADSDRPSASAATARCGDVNGDGRITVQDAILALRIAGGFIKPTPAMFAAADVAPLDNPDGKITIEDAVVILKVAIGLIKPTRLICQPLISFSTDIQPIFESGTCTRVACHGKGETKPGGHPMLLIRGQSYRSIVNVPAEEAPNLKRVDPGRPATSYLLAKVEGTEANFGMPSLEEKTNLRMPQFCNQEIPDPRMGGCLNTYQIGLLSTWILEGAANN